MLHEKRYVTVNIYNALEFQKRAQARMYIWSLQTEAVVMDLELISEWGKLGRWL